MKLPRWIVDELVEANLRDVRIGIEMARAAHEGTGMAHKGQRGEQGSVHTDKKTDMTVVKATCGGKRGK